MPNWHTGRGAFSAANLEPQRKTLMCSHMLSRLGDTTTLSSTLDYSLGIAATVAASLVLWKWGRITTWPTSVNKWCRDTLCSNYLLFARLCPLQLNHPAALKWNHHIHHQIEEEEGNHDVPLLECPCNTFFWDMLPSSVIRLAATTFVIELKLMLLMVSSFTIFHCCIAH